MKLSLEEARKRATPGKLGDALGVLVAESGKRLPLSNPRKPFTTDEECANAALLKHCWNRFDEVVAALEMHVRFRPHSDECSCRSETSGPVVDETKCDCWVARDKAVLAKAKTVEVP